MEDLTPIEMVGRRAKCSASPSRPAGQPFQVVHLMKLIQRWSREHKCQCSGVNGREHCRFCSDLDRRRRSQSRRCGPPHKKPAGCPQDLRRPHGRPGWTRYSTAERPPAPPAARCSAAGGEAGLQSGRSGDACTTSCLGEHGCPERLHGDKCYRSHMLIVKDEEERPSWAFYSQAEGSLTAP